MSAKQMRVLRQFRFCFNPDHFYLPAYASALRAAIEWIESECRPDAEWVAQGHNWSMSDEDRERGLAILYEGRVALAHLYPAVPA